MYVYLFFQTFSGSVPIAPVFLKTQVCSNIFTLPARDNYSFIIKPVFYTRKS